MRSLVLCRSMVSTPLHYKGLDAELWNLIWSYLNEYKYLWNAVNLEYLSTMAYDLYSRNIECRDIHDYDRKVWPLCKRDTCKTRLVKWIGSFRVEPSGSLRTGLWYDRNITVRGQTFVVEYNGRTFQICKIEDQFIMSVSINSVKGREILSEFKLEPFFGGYIQPVGTHGGFEHPDLTWKLEDTWIDEQGLPDGGYEGLKASIHAQRAEDLDVRIPDHFPGFTARPVYTAFPGTPEDMLRRHPPSEMIQIRLPGAQPGDYTISISSIGLLPHNLLSTVRPYNVVGGMFHPFRGFNFDEDDSDDEEIPSLEVN